MTMNEIGMERFKSYEAAVKDEKKVQDFENSMREIRSTLTVKDCIDDTARDYHLPAVEY
ncbi:MAG: hypothetical protein K6G01_03270 [Eubacterium sp.]|nr:hypothetical protein [Eubacterium sp.]